MSQNVRRTARRVLAVAIGVTAAAVLIGPLAGGAAAATGDRIVLAEGQLVKGSTTYPNAVVTYDPVLDATDQGSNPGLVVWPSAEAEAAGTGRLSRSNDNNGQWDYRVDCAYGFNNTVYIVGARSSNGGATFVPRVWNTSAGSFLTQSAGI